MLHISFIYTHTLIVFLNYVSGIIAIGKINEAIDSGDPQATLTALLLPQAKIFDVDANLAMHYQHMLSKQKEHRAKVWLTLILLFII